MICNGWSLATTAWVVRLDHCHDGLKTDYYNSQSKPCLDIPKQRTNKGPTSMLCVSHKVHDDFNAALLRCVPHHFQLVVCIDGMTANDNTEPSIPILRSQPRVENILPTKARHINLRVHCDVISLDGKPGLNSHSAVISSNFFKDFTSRLAQCTTTNGVILCYYFYPLPFDFLSATNLHDTTSLRCSFLVEKMGHLPNLLRLTIQVQQSNLLECYVSQAERPRANMRWQVGDSTGAVPFEYQYSDTDNWDYFYNAMHN